MYAFFNTFSFPLNIFTHIVYICITTESNKDIRISKRNLPFSKGLTQYQLHIYRFTFKGDLVTLCIISD